MTTNNSQAEPSQDEIVKESRQRLAESMRKGVGFRNVRNPLVALLLEANGGCVVGGSRNKDGSIIIEGEEEQKPRLKG